VTVPLPGGQTRARQAILYVAKRCESAKFFGAIKLNKILWKAERRYSRKGRNRFSGHAPYSRTSSALVLSQSSHFSPRRSSGSAIRAKI